MSVSSNDKPNIVQVSEDNLTVTVISSVGPSGVIAVTAPITNSGTSTSANIGINQSGITVAQSQVTSLVSDLALKAPLASPTFTGTPTLPTGTIATTQTAGNSTTAVATTAFVTTANQLLGTYTSYTPALTNITIGNGTITASYCRVNNFVHAIGKILFGSTTVVSAANVNIFLPVNADTSPTNVPWGWLSMVDQSAGLVFQGTNSLSGNTDRAWVQALTTTGSYAGLSNISPTVPFTWANTDYISFNIYYKAA